MHAIERLYPFACARGRFYSGWVMPDTFAAVQYDNWCYLNGGLEGSGRLPVREAISITANVWSV